MMDEPIKIAAYLIHTHRQEVAMDVVMRGYGLKVSRKQVGDGVSGRRVGFVLSRL